LETKLSRGVADLVHYACILVYYDYNLDERSDYLQWKTIREEKNSRKIFALIR